MREFTSCKREIQRSAELYRRGRNDRTLRSGGHWSTITQALVRLSDPRNAAKFLRWVNLPVWEVIVSWSSPNIRELVNLPVQPLRTRLINYTAIGTRLPVVNDNGDGQGRRGNERHSVNICIITVIRIFPRITWMGRWTTFCINSIIYRWHLHHLIQNSFVNTYVSCKLERSTNDNLFDRII